jgi:hypothetical protein
MKYLLFLGLILTVSGSLIADEPPTVLVYLLAGQSNMEGHAKIETLDYLADNQDDRELYQLVMDANGKPRQGNNVWISYLTGAGEPGTFAVGKLTTGFGARQNPANDGGKIGPEYAFGLRMEQIQKKPIVIIKTAWGGKSLYYDFRSPSSGVYPRSASDIEKGRNPEAESGKYYRLMVEHTKKVLADLKSVYPEYQPGQKVQLAGFVWLQGWNDMVNREVYPIKDAEPTRPRYADYSKWMANLIRDLRNDLSAPKLPAVIGVMGVGGSKPNEHVAAFRIAMAQPAALPEFRGNVLAVETSPFWDERLAAIADKQEDVRQMARMLRTKNKNGPNKDGAMNDQQQKEYVEKYSNEIISPEELSLWKRGASNAGYHYLGCGKTFVGIGNAFAEALANLQKKTEEIDKADQ